MLNPSRLPRLHRLPHPALPQLVAGISILPRISILSRISILLGVLPLPGIPPLRTTLLPPAVLILFSALILLNGCSPEQPNRQAAFTALARWEDRRLAPEDSLLAMINDADAHIRLRAIRAAGRIGRRDAAPALIAALRDRSPTVAGQAAFSLGLLGDLRAVPPMEDILAGRGNALRLATIRGLALLPHQGQALLREAANPDPEFSAAAWDALRDVADPRAQVHADSAAVATAVLAALARPESDVRWRALRCAERVAGPELLGRLANHLTATDPRERVHAFRAVACCPGEDALEAVLSGIELMPDRPEHPPHRTAIAAANALGRLGHHAFTPGNTFPAARRDLLTDFLIASAGSPEPHLARAALGAMTAIAGHFPLPLEAAEQESLLPVWRIRLARAAGNLVQAESPSRRAAALRAWAALRGRGALPELQTRLGTETDKQVKSALLLTLPSLGPGMLPLLQAHLTDPDPTVQRAALDALAQYADKQPETTPAVRDLLTRGAAATDFTVAATACGHLAQHPDRLSLMALVEAWDTTFSEGRAEVRRAILGTLTAYGPGIQELRRQGIPSGPNNQSDRNDPLLITCGEILREAFDSPDLRLRLEARSAALATGLLPPRLIPTEGSLRATLPPWQRTSRQPAARGPFRAGKVRLTTGRGSIVMELDGENAPNTCAMFLDLVGNGFYDGQVFHRVVPDFVAQGGDPRADGWGGPGYTIRSEWSSRPFVRGTVGIAHDGKDTGGSQFFITLSEQPHLNGRYTVFGRVVDGMDVADALVPGDRFQIEIMP